MENRTLNLIFAVITGKPKITEMADLDVWKCKSGVTLLTDLFIKDVSIRKDI